jgi:two-component system heavy metal sensor histidine kinase CusS
MISFRTRLFFIATSIVLLVLVVVMMLAWSSVMKNEVEHLDERLCLETHRFGTQDLSQIDLAIIESDLVVKFRLKDQSQLMLRNHSDFDMSEIKSSRWQDAVIDKNLKWNRSTAQGLLGPDRPPRRGNGPRLDGEGKPLPPPRSANVRARCELASLTLDNSEWRIARNINPRGQTFIAVNLAATKAELQAGLQRAMWLIVPLALLLSSLGAWLLANITMRPVNRLREAMKGITQNELDQRLQSRGEDIEFKELIGTYNNMLQRLETSFHQASRFSGDAAHELRTPLTILQGRIEQTLHKTDDLQLQTELTQMLDEVSRLTSITRKLLLLSYADAGKLSLHYSRIHLTELLLEKIEDAKLMVHEQTLSSRINDNLFIQGDIILLQQLFNNLISNAIRYCPPHGTIHIESFIENKGVVIIFQNASVIIPLEERAQFFDRFYRGNTAHQREIDGHGLGLSLATEIAKAHGGELQLANSALNIVSFRLWLPHESSN